MHAFLSELFCEFLSQFKTMETTIKTASKNVDNYLNNDNNKESNPTNAIATSNNIVGNQLESTLTKSENFEGINF